MQIGGLFSDRSGLCASVLGRLGQDEIADTRCCRQGIGGLFRPDVFREVVRVTALDVVAFEEHGVIHELLE